MLLKLPSNVLFASWSIGIKRPSKMMMAEAIIIGSKVDKGGGGRHWRWVLVEVRSSVMAFDGGSLYIAFCRIVGGYLWDEAA